MALHWVPSHDKPLPHGWRPPSGYNEQVVRALNHKADRAARRCASALAHGSGRQSCIQQRAAARAWEMNVLEACASIAAFYDAMG